MSASDASHRVALSVPLARGRHGSSSSMAFLSPDDIPAGTRGGAGGHTDGADAGGAPVAFDSDVGGGGAGDDRHSSRPGLFRRRQPPADTRWWASTHPDEMAQSFAEFSRLADRRTPSAAIRDLILIPVGHFDVARGEPGIREVASVISAFFGLPTATTRPVSISLVSTKMRRGVVGQWQLHAGEILEYVKMHGRSPSSFACIAVTMADLYPHEDWNFVFGEYRHAEGIGVVSLARYDPSRSYLHRSLSGSAAETSGSVDDKGAPLPRLEEREAQLLLQRSLKLLTHELSHMFALSHCTEWECRLNGCATVSELDAQATALCPTCLKKLQLATGFDPIGRYMDLWKAYAHIGLVEEADWVDARLQSLGMIPPQSRGSSRGSAPSRGASAESGRVSRGSGISDIALRTDAPEADVAPVTWTDAPRAPPPGPSYETDIGLPRESSGMPPRPSTGGKRLPPLPPSTGAHEGSTR